jgi:hypothetical protein
MLCYHAKFHDCILSGISVPPPGSEAYTAASMVLLMVENPTL